LRAFEGLGRNSCGHVVGLELGFVLERQQPSEFLLDLRAIRTGLAQQREDLIVVLARFVLQASVD